MKKCLRQVGGAARLLITLLPTAYPLPHCGKKEISFDKKIYTISLLGAGRPPTTVHLSSLHFLQKQTKVLNLALPCLLVVVFGGSSIHSYANRELINKCQAQPCISTLTTPKLSKIERFYMSNWARIYIAG